MKIAIILSRFPFPLEKGDKLRAFQHLKALASEHEVHLFALSDKPVQKEGLKKIGKICESVTCYRLSKIRIFLNLLNAFVSGLPLQVGYFFSGSVRNRMQSDINKLQPDLIYCQLIRTVLYTKGTDSRKIIDFQDAFVTGTAQRLERANFFLKPIFKRELNLVKKFENNSFSLFERHFIISDEDKAGINHPEKDRIVVLPNGVDTDFFTRKSNPEEGRILFVGNMNYPPNIDAAEYLAREVMPVVWQSDPGIELTLAGANPSVAVRSLKNDKVEVTGWVDDIRDVYEKATVFVAPMRIGTGMQNKLLEAMSMEIPCISTSLSSDPLKIENGKHLIVANSADEIAGSIIELIRNHERSASLARNGRIFLEENYALGKMNRVILDLTKN